MRVPDVPDGGTKKMALPTSRLHREGTSIERRGLTLRWSRQRELAGHEFALRLSAKRWADSR